MLTRLAPRVAALASVVLGTSACHLVGLPERRAPQCQVSATNMSAFRKDFLASHERLNAADRDSSVARMREGLVGHHPPEFSRVIMGLTDDVIDELHYIMVMYPKTLKLGSTHIDILLRVSVRTRMAELLSATDLWSEDELRFFQHVLVAHGCIAEPPPCRADQTAGRDA